MSYYQTAKDDWAVPDIVQTTDMNIIGNNSIVNRMGGGESTMPSYAIAADLTLDLIHNAFEITGTTTINRVEFYNGVSITREYGNIITLFFTGVSGATVNTTGMANSSTHLGIIASTGITQINISQYDCLQLILMEISSIPRWIALQVHNTGNG